MAVVVNFLGSRRTEAGDYISWGYMRMFLATTLRTLKLLNAISTEQGDEVLLDHLKKSVRAERPDKAKYAEFFDLDDLLAHICALFEEKQWHLLKGNDRAELSKLRRVTVVNLKISNMYRSSDVLSINTGSLLQEADDQCKDNSRWGPLEAEGPGGNIYPAFVILHLRDSKTGAKIDRLDAFPEEPALCPVFALWCYAKAIKGLPRNSHDAMGSVFVSNNKQNTGETTLHRRVMSASTLAGDTKGLMDDAGIEEHYGAHALRGATASSHLDKGADEESVMLKAGWLSSSVFKRFYARTQIKKISVQDLRVSTAAEEEDAPREPRAAPRLSLQARLRTKDADGNTLKIPEACTKEGVDLHCFSCDDPSDHTMIWCEYCNKHLHSKHFGNPAEAEDEFLTQGWGCGECLALRSSIAQKKKKTKKSKK